MQVDGYAGFERLADSGRVVLAACWAHTRRKCYELAEGTGSPIAVEALTLIAALYRIEADIRGRSADERVTARQAQSRPLIEAMKPWLEREFPGR